MNKVRIDLKRQGFLIGEQDNNKIFAERESTGKQIVVGKNEDELEKIFAETGIHPFLLKDGKYLCLLSGDILNRISFKRFFCSFCYCFCYAWKII